MDAERGRRNYDRPAAAPAGPVMALTFINSLGTGVVTLGVYFLVSQPKYGFTETGNYGLGLAFALAYVAAAFKATAITRALPGATRRSLGLVLWLMGLVSCLPWAASQLPGWESGWAWWVMVLLYAPLSGVCWPMTESYVSGGLPAEALRKRTGQFNVVWGFSMIVALIAMAPLVENHQELVVAGLGLSHIASTVCLRGLSAEPASHHNDRGEAQDRPSHSSVTLPSAPSGRAIEHEPAEPAFAGAEAPEREQGRDLADEQAALQRDRALLPAFRVQLGMSYVVYGAVSPYMPTVLDRLGLSASAETPFTAIWLSARFVGFVVLERWGGWRHRVWLALAAGVLLIVGFAAVVLPAGLDADRSLRLAMTTAGLLMFGLGMAAAYAGAIYYTMSARSARVDAGGTHEAVIGLGMSAGPGIGLLITLSAVPAGAVAGAVVGVVAAICVVGGPAAYLALRTRTDRFGAAKPSKIKTEVCTC